MQGSGRLAAAERSSCLPLLVTGLVTLVCFWQGNGGRSNAPPRILIQAIFDWKVWVSGPISMAALTLEQKLELGASDLRLLLTNHGIQDAHQGALFEAGVDTMAKFAAFVTTAADLVEVLKKEFSLDPATSLANRAQVASYTVAWQSAQARTKQQAEVEATSPETREWAKPIPVSDYIAMRQRFAKALGEPEDKRIPAKEYIEKKLAELEAGEFRAETLGEVLSRDEVDPDVLVPHWDAKGHLSVKKGSSSVAMPTGPEQLRLRLTVMYNVLAMIKLKHPGRNELTDINADLIEKYKDYLLGDYVYGLRSAEAAGSMIPPWTLVLSYEHAVRKFANKLVSQEGYKFGEALKKAWKDATIKERHWSADGPPATLAGAEKAARKGALKATRASHIPISPARAPPGRPITSPFASATMPKEDARRGR